MKNIYVECTNLADKSVHLSCNDYIAITINSRVGEDSMKVATIVVRFTEEGVCKVELFDESENRVGETENDIAAVENIRNE